MLHPRDSFSALILITILTAAGFGVLLVPVGGVGASDEAPPRSDKYFLDADFTMNIDWKTEDLWVVVFVQNMDQYPGKDAAGSDKFFNYMEVANSYAFPVDGNQYSSGNVRRPLVELFTSLTCTLCPSAEESINKVVEDRGLGEMSLIEFHEGDSYETGSSGHRFDLYNVTGTPTAIFDGQYGRVGGDSSVNSPMLVNAYNRAIDTYSVYDPYVILSGSASTSGNQCSLNVSFEVIDALSRGNWSLKAVIVEDLKNDDKGATMRFTQRRTFSRNFPELQADSPVVTVDRKATFNGIDSGKVMGDLVIYWSANDPQDGTSLAIDIQYSRAGGSWSPLVEGIPNTGSYTWNTTGFEDGKYLIRMVAEDSDGNRVISGSHLTLTVNNPDFPVGEMIFPMAGDSLRGLARIRWDSSDDEDPLNDLLVNISLSSDGGTTWEVITYNQITGSDFIADTNVYDLNTLNFPDLNTYMLRIRIKDRDGMLTEIFSDVFEIYNNDAPRVWIISPDVDEVVSGILDIGWRIEDEEDQAWGMVENMTGNFSISKAGNDGWQSLYIGSLDTAMENKTFDTSDLMGDGNYTLRFTVTDSRGMTAQVDRKFRIYDPDPPFFTGPVRGPGNADDYRNDTFVIGWSAKDPDVGETLTYIIEITPAREENWTVLAREVVGETYDVVLSDLAEGLYRLRVTAVDDSTLHLTSSEEYGPFFYNAPDAPHISWIYPDQRFNGTLREDPEITNATGTFVVDLLWSGSDPDGDSLSYSLFWKRESDSDWRILKKDLDSTSLTWNMTGLTDGSYMLKLVARDGSVRHLTTEAVLGPFSVDVWEPPAAANGNISSDDDIQSSSGVDIGVVIGISAGGVLLVVLLVIGILVVLNRSTGKRKHDAPVIPTENDVDLSIPGFERTLPTPVPARQQMISPPPDTVSMRQYPAPPAEGISPGQGSAPSVKPYPGQVSWDEGERTTMPGPETGMSAPDQNEEPSLQTDVEGQSPVSAEQITVESPDQETSTVISNESPAGSNDPGTE